MNPWLEITLRSSGLFIVSLILIRLMGKREPSHMTPFKFTNYIVIAVIAALISTKVIGNRLTL